MNFITPSSSKPNGFQYSVVFRIKGAPWIGESATAYEDWYLVEGSCDLDSLNDAAISHSHKDSHDRVALRAAGGAGGLYRFRTGQVNVPQSEFAIWFSKPTGISYEMFYDSLSQWTITGSWIIGTAVLGDAEFVCSSGQNYLPETLMNDIRLNLSVEDIARCRDAFEDFGPLLA